MRTVRLFPLVLLIALACSKSEEKPTTEPAGDPPTSDPPAAIDAAAQPKTDPPAAIDAAIAAAEFDAGAQAKGDPPEGDSKPDPAGPGMAPADKNSGPPKNIKILSKKWSRKQINDYMKKQYNRGLGVKCKFCHDKDDFAADTNKHKKITRDMQRMQNRLNKQYFGGKPKVTCYTCHKGEKEP